MKYGTWVSESEIECVYMGFNDMMAGEKSFLFIEIERERANGSW